MNGVCMRMMGQFTCDVTLSISSLIFICKKGISGVGEWKRQEIEAATADLKDTEKMLKQKSEGQSQASCVFIYSSEICYIDSNGRCSYLVCFAIPASNQLLGTVQF